MCWAGGGGVVMPCVRTFIRIYPDEMGMAQMKRDCKCMWEEQVFLPLPRLMKLFCGSPLPFHTALIYKVYFLGEMGEKQM